MKNKVIWLGLSLLLVAAMLLASCAKSTTISTSTSTSTSTKTTPTTTTSTTTKTTTSTTQAATTATTTTITGNWWDKLSTPQYGGEMVIRQSVDVGSFDPYDAGSNPTIMSAWLENMFRNNWTINPSVFAYNIDWRPPDYVTGNFAASWEFTDPSTLVVHLRQGIYWQNIPPANGREFTSADAADLPPIAIPLVM